VTAIELKGTVAPCDRVMVDQHECPSTYPNDSDYSSSQDGPSTDPSPDMQEQIEEHIEEQTLTAEEAIKLTRNVVEATRQEMRQTLRGSEEVGEALKLSLTIDLSRRGVDEIPDEMVEVLKQDVERYLLIHPSPSNMGHTCAHGRANAALQADSQLQFHLPNS